MLHPAVGSISFENSRRNFHFFAVGNICCDVSKEHVAEPPVIHATPTSVSTCRRSASQGPTLPVDRAFTAVPLDTMLSALLSGYTTKCRTEYKLLTACLQMTCTVCWLQHFVTVPLGIPQHPLEAHKDLELLYGHAYKDVLLTAKRFSHTKLTLLGRKHSIENNTSTTTLNRNVSGDCRQVSLPPTHACISGM